MCWHKTSVIWFFISWLGRNKHLKQSFVAHQHFFKFKISTELTSEGYRQNASIPLVRLALKNCVANGSGVSGAKRGHYSIAKTDRLIFCDFGASSLDGWWLILNAMKSCTRWWKSGAKIEIGGGDIAISIPLDFAEKSQFLFCMIIVTALLKNSADINVLFM